MPSAGKSPLRLTRTLRASFDLPKLASSLETVVSIQEFRPATGMRGILSMVLEARKPFINISASVCELRVSVLEVRTCIKP
eukprot:g64775.t1